MRIGGWAYRRFGAKRGRRFISPTRRHAFVLTLLLALAVPACRWKPSFPANRIASSLRHMCSTDYKLSVEARHEQRALQALVWKVGLFKGPAVELQGVSREALDALDHVLLCATRIALSTDAPLDF